MKLLEWVKYSHCAQIYKYDFIYSNNIFKLADMDFCFRIKKSVRHKDFYDINLVSFYKLEETDYISDYYGQIYIDTIYSLKQSKDFAQKYYDQFLEDQRNGIIE